MSGRINIYPQLLEHKEEAYDLVDHTQGVGADINAAIDAYSSQRHIKAAAAASGTASSARYLAKHYTKLAEGLDEVAAAIRKERGGELEGSSTAIVLPVEHEVLSFHEQEGYARIKLPYAFAKELFFDEKSKTRRMQFTHEGRHYQGARCWLKEYPIDGYWEMEVEIL